MHLGLHGIVDVGDGGAVLEIVNCGVVGASDQHYHLANVLLVLVGEFLSVVDSAGYQAADRLAAVAQGFHLTDNAVESLDQQ